jgi:hypothetical protein
MLLHGFVCGIVVYILMLLYRFVYARIMYVDRVHVFGVVGLLGCVSMCECVYVSRRVCTSCVDLSVVLCINCAWVW